MTDAITARFEHSPLDTTKHQIRLVKVAQSSRKARAHHGSQSEATISCLVEHYDLKEDHVVKSDIGKRPSKLRERPLQYAAVSHTWGDETSPAEIKVNGSPFCIRRNLYDFLYVISQQTAHTNRLLWIDQLCIDQDRTTERNHQVQLMADIFMRAEQVMAWLGVDTKITPTILHAYEALEVVSKKHPLECSFADWKVIRELMLSQGMGREHRFALSDFFASPYWSRLWITQEVFLARKLVFCCGSYTLKAPRGAHARNMLSLMRGWIPSGSSSDDPRLWDRPYQVMYLLARNEEFSKGQESSAGDDRKWFTPPSLVYNYYVNLECADPRDKVFGLQACLRPEYRVSADYSLNVDQVFCLVVDAFTDPQGPWSYEADRSGTLGRIAKAMGVEYHDWTKMHERLDASDYYTSLQQAWTLTEND